MSSWSEDSWVRLCKTVSSSSSSLISGSWSIDTEWHIIKVTRDSSDNFELFFDGVSKGTTTDTILTSSKQIRLHAYQETQKFDDLEVF